MVTTCAIRVWLKNNFLNLKPFGGARVGAIDMAPTMSKLVQKPIDKTPSKLRTSNHKQKHLKYELTMTQIN